MRDLGLQQVHRSLYGFDKGACTDVGYSTAVFMTFALVNLQFRCVTKKRFRLSTSSLIPAVFDWEHLQTMKIDFALFFDFDAFLASLFSTDPPLPTQRTMDWFLGDSLFSPVAHDFEMRRTSDQRDAL